MALTTRRFKLSLALALVLVFIVLTSTVITSLGERRAGLHASRAFVCLSRMKYFLSFFSHGSAVAYDIGTSWVFHLKFYK